ncbi:aspartic proteinase CDR1-like, partial [Prosopis cineraria]|uniref:aspartic proteinase CDR1-like n=1 Tax=Prosopis cineraria TaxID=364024 RepID=UPI0024101A44
NGSILKTLILRLTIFILSSTFVIVFTKAAKLGFTMDLIHRDSPLSPLYDNSTTPYQKMHYALRRSAKRLNYFSPNNNVSTETNHDDDPEADINVSGREYLMTYSIGTPEFQTRGFADTGSDLVWLQCLPCQSCFPQEADKFNPLNSYTHINVLCDSQRCESARRSVSKQSCDQSNVCRYFEKYGGGSTSEGIISHDTLTLGSTSGGKVRFTRFTFGCGYNNNEKFSRKTSGIVGLGRGPLSLVSQISSFIDGYFSYCLVPPFVASSVKLKFGQSALFSGPDVVSTPLVSKWPPTYYYLTLEAMSVAGKRIRMPSGTEGNIVIDSGTTVTYLPRDFYTELKAEVSIVMDQRSNRAFHPLGDLCYETQRIEDVGAPIITAHFKGADVLLDAINTFIMVDYEVACFSFKDTSDIAIYGNVAQLNFLIGHDLQKNLVSFKPADLESEVAENIQLDRTSNPSNLNFSLCYESGSVETFEFPIITLHFNGDADVVLSPHNIFFAVTPSVVCFAFQAMSSDGAALIGNVAQIDFLVGYDLHNNIIFFFGNIHNNIISFKPMDCSNQP